MDDPRVNIDLLFRNGLRDYEVLPPAEVWDNIHPSVRRNHANLFLRAAAIAIISSLAFLAYFLTSSGPVRSGLVSDFYINLGDPVHIPAGSYDINPVLMPVKSPLYETTEREITISGNTDEALILNVNEFAMPDVSNIQPFTDYRIRNEEDLNIKIPDFVPDHNSYGLSPVASYPENRWTLSAMASPTYFSSFGADNSTAGKLMSSEHPVISYSGGLSVAYRISKRFSIQTGLFYATLDRSVDGINSYAGFRRYNDAKGNHTFEVMTTSGPVYTSNSDVFLYEAGNQQRIVKGYASGNFDPEKADLIYLNSTITQNFSYLQMPVIVRYKFIDRALDFNIVGGVSYDFLVDNAAFAGSGNSKYDLGTTMGVNTLTFSSSLGMGMEYNLSDKISLNVEPTFHYYLNPFNQPGNLKIHPYSFGIFSGFSYKF